MTQPTDKLTLRRAVYPSDAADIGRLCWAYRALLEARSGHVPTFVETYYSADEFEALLAKLPQYHARPRGDIWVAELHGGVVGCAMYHPISETTCEIKRVFVDPVARGTGAGRALVDACRIAAAQDGYTDMVLDTIHTLHEAIALYERLGFHPCPPFYEPDPLLIETLRFYACPLP